MLIQKYSRKLDRAEATTLTIQDVKTDMRQGSCNSIFGFMCMYIVLQIIVCPLFLLAIVLSVFL